MPGRDMTVRGPTRKAQAWAKDFIRPENLMPAGGVLVAAAFAADAYGKKPIESGVVVGRTFAERDLFTGFGPFLETDDEIFIVAFDVEDALVIPECALIRPGFAVAENYLPGWAAYTAAQKAKIRALFRTVLGEN